MMSTLLPCAVFAGSVTLYAAAACALALSQDRLLLHPGRRSPDMGPALSCRVRDWLPSSDYAGMVVEPRNPGELTGTVLIFHGNAGDAEGRLPLASRFVQLGYRAILAEYPGFGRRTGRLSLTGALAACETTLEQSLREFGEPLVLVGESLGAGMAGQLVAKYGKDIAGVVLATPWDSLASVASAKLPVLPVRHLLKHPFDTITALSAYQGPVVVIASENDRLIPMRHAQKLAASRLDTLLLTLKAGHNDWFLAMPEEKWNDVGAWLASSASIRFEIALQSLSAPT